MPLLTEREHRAATACVGKGAQLQALRGAGFRVPEFVISPGDVGEAVRRLGLPLAARSSASVEDGRDLSFAGQFESYLNLGTVEAVEGAIAACRESVFAPSVVEYCRRHGVDAWAVRMEVIVQRMVQPELAGVAFTVNPLTGAEEVMIEACAGLADELLAGRVAALPDGHPLLERHRPAIAAAARAIQRHFGEPQDVEFAVERGELFILQARPITRIAFAAPAPDFHAGDEWTNADFRDGGVSSSVCTPLMWSLYDFVWEHTLKESLRQLKLLDGDFQAGRMFYGRPYWNLAAVKRCLLKLPGFVEREFDEDLSVEVTYAGAGRATPVTPGGVIRAIPTLLAIRSYFRRQAASARRLLAGDFAERARPYEALPEDVEASFRRLVERDYFFVESSYFRTIFAASLAKLDFLASFPEAGYPALVAALPPLRHMEPVRRVQQMTNRGDGPLADVVAEYRHHCRLGLDVCHPRWDEDCEFVTDMLAALPAPAGGDPRPAYETARAAALSALPHWKRRAFGRKLDRLRRFVWLREELRDLSSRMYYYIRRHALRIADRRGLGDDIFFMTFREIFDDDRTGIAHGREVYESYRSFRAPNEIGSRYPLDRRPAVGGCRGIAASPGTVRGRAHVAHNVEQAARMASGDILVCPFTDPGWTPVLDRAAGVVTETGGLLSHAAIICREYGIPAVLGVERATSRIAHGSTIAVYGGTGEVELFEPTSAGMAGFERLEGDFPCIVI